MAQIYKTTKIGLLVLLAYSVVPSYAQSVDGAGASNTASGEMADFGVAEGRDGLSPASNRLEALEALPTGFYKAYLQAREFEPTFQTAKAEREYNQIGASAARAAYLPELRYSRSRLETESTPRTTLSIAQPLIAADRFATFREGSHRDALSDLTFEQREQELAVRIFKIITDIIKYSENQRTNKAKIVLLEQQYASAKRMLALGEGTVTDVFDTQVRLGQSRAESLTIKGNLDAAIRQYELTCGQSPVLADFRLSQEIRAFPVKPQELDLSGGADSSPVNTQVNIAVQNYQMAKLATLKAQAGSLPSLFGSYTQTEISGTKSNYVGITLQFPLQPTGLYSMYGAKANEFKMQESIKEAENKARLDIERLKSLLDAGIVEVQYRRENIEAANLNVMANEKSMMGGVRSKTDVLNAIQLKSQANDDYVTSVMTLAENYLNFALASNVKPDDALRLVNKLVF